MEGLMEMTVVKVFLFAMKSVVGHAPGIPQQSRARTIQ
jgi:hypothetical protein